MQSYARVTKLCWALGYALAGCSSASQTGSTADDEVGEQSLALFPSFLQSVRAYRPPSVSVISALDSQNALPSGVLADPAMLRRLRILGGQRLVPSSPAVAGLRDLPGGGGAVLLKYLARCALREIDTSVLPGYPGRLGLAPAWPVRALTPPEQRWVTACLMAHTNNLASVSIAASGALPVFSTAGSHAGPPLSYPYEEAAFYGNLFGNTPQLFACSGAGTQRSCSDRGAGEDLQRRICGTASAANCGFVYMHECNKLASSGAWTDGVCTAALPYANCGTTTGIQITEVVTTSLRTDAELLGLHPSCGQRSGPSCAPPAHDVCTMGVALGQTCSGGVCASDPYCCSVIWDSNCVAKARLSGACP